MITFKRKISKDNTDRKNILNMLSKGRYKLNLMLPYPLILSLKNTFFIIFTLLLACSVRAQDVQKPFITTWGTSAPDESITIPTNSSLTYSYTVDWGDGSTDTKNHTGDALLIHTLHQALT